MKQAVALALASTLMVAGLVFAPIASYTACYLVLAACLIALILYGPSQFEAARQRPMAAVLGAFVLLALTLPFVYRTPADLVPLVILLPLLLVAGVPVLARLERSFFQPGFFALLCLTGAITACAAGFSEQAMAVAGRAGVGNNPIHFGSLAVLIGLVARLGLFASKSPWRYLFLLGPVMGIGAVIASGSRGPLLGAVGMTVVAAPLLVVWLWRDKIFLSLAAIGAVGAAAVVATQRDQRAFQALADLGNVMNLSSVLDVYRQAMYRSALIAFEQSPLVGHGFGQMMVFARQQMPDSPDMQSFDHLHADWANFVTMGGALGLAAYLLLVIAPLLVLIPPAARRDKVLVLGAMLLFAGQFVLGLTNTTFGVMPQSMLYVTVLGWLAARADELHQREAGVR